PCYAVGHAPLRAPIPGHWRQVTAAGLENFADIGLVRGRDGVLHVLWTSGSRRPAGCIQPEARQPACGDGGEVRYDPRPLMRTSRPHSNLSEMLSATIWSASATVLGNSSDGSDFSQALA